MQPVQRSCTWPKVGAEIDVGFFPSVCSSSKLGPQWLCVGVSCRHGRMPNPLLPTHAGKPPSREELRERLQKKLEVLRQQRKADEKTAQVQAAREWRDQALAHSRKQAQQAKRQQKPQERAAAAAGQADKQRQQQQQGRKKRGSEGEGEAAATLAFSRIEFGAGGCAGPALLGTLSGHTSPPT